MLPFIAGLVLSIFSFSAEVKLIHWDGKLFSCPKAPDQPLLGQKTADAPFGHVHEAYMSGWKLA